MRWCVLEVATRAEELMTTESTELQALLKDTREYVSYFEELGVTGVELKPAQTSEQESPRVAASAPTTRIPSSTPTSSRVQRPIEKPRTSFELPVATHVSQEKRAQPSLSQDNLFGDLAPRAPVITKSGESLEQIWAEVGDCTRCPLYEGRTNVVHTEGSRKARLMFVGEAPGADEDAQARPFVGRAGQLLTKIIESIGFKREDVLIGNVNRCRPPGNRAPTPDEAAACKPFLLREIESVAPEVIVVLGNTAMKNLLEVKEGITRLRGIFQDYKGIKIMPTFHPAYLLRDPSKKRETWEDLKKVRDYLEGTSKKEN